MKERLPFTGVWVTSRMLGKAADGTITPLCCLILALTAEWNPVAGWVYYTDCGTVKSVADLLGLSTEEVKLHLDHMRDFDVLTFDNTRCKREGI